jgi:hypothetical protein
VNSLAGLLPDILDQARARRAKCATDRRNFFLYHAGVRVPLQESVFTGTFAGTLAVDTRLPIG